ncbi:MAG: penicillin-binding protein activator LpoB [Victivallales bacterium]|nr:penicillin-binding protein activator LpoB [Victivallales bacterium]
MKVTIASCVALLFGMVLFCGCGTPARRIDPTGTGGLTTVDDINFKDWQMAAEKGIVSLLESGVLERQDGRKMVLMISDVENRTTQHIDTRILTDKIRQAVLRSGKAVTTTAVGARGAEDKATRQLRQLEDDDMFDQSTVQKAGTAISPDMSLAGRIIQQRTTSGRTSESYFFIHMTLTDSKTGLGLWGDSVEIVKQGQRPLMGF